MQALAPIVMILWVFVTISLFFKHSPQKAIVISVFGGIMFLPVYSIEIAGLPDLSKASVIAIGILLGEIISGSRVQYSLKYSIFDLPMMIWCFLSPILSAYSNSLGFYYGFSIAVENYLVWGVFYWAGRRYFNTVDSLKLLLKGFLYGGLIYIPLILYEIKMSPRLNIMIYGYFQHDWRQHKRYGGWRPIVFMDHGIMVALFMVCATIAFFWLWKSGKLSKIKNFKISQITIVLIIVSILCRVAAGWVYLFLGILFFYRYFKKNSVSHILILLLIIPVYMVLRITQVISAESVGNIASFFFDDERVVCLGIRLLQEDLFSVKALERPFLGWGGMTRAWPVNIDTGRLLITMIDSLWMILFSRFGLVGLFSVYTGLGAGPLLVLSLFKKGRNFKGLFGDDWIPIEVIILCLMVVLFLVDTLVNGMVNQMFVMVSGALLSFYLLNKYDSESIKSV